MPASLPSLDHLMRCHQLWWAAPAASAASAVVSGMAGVPTGLPRLDTLLPMGGWPPAALTELLLPAEGLGEMQLLWPTLARLTQSGGRVVLVAPPFIPFPQAWLQAGIRLPWLELIEATGRDALWALEQCLRSGSCAAVLGWPRQADHTALRRLQVAAERGQCLGFIMRHARHAVQTSPAALRLQLLPGSRFLVLKCRGGMSSDQPLSWLTENACPPAVAEQIRCGQRLNASDALSGQCRSLGHELPPGMSKVMNGFRDGAGQGAHERFAIRHGG